MGVGRAGRSWSAEGQNGGVDATTLEANAAMRSIVRPDNGASYEEVLKGLAKQSGIETPSREDLARIDRKRKKKTSNQEWASRTPQSATGAYIRVFFAAECSPEALANLHLTPRLRHGCSVVPSQSPSLTAITVVVAEFQGVPPRAVSLAMVSYCPPPKPPFFK